MTTPAITPAMIENGIVMIAPPKLPPDPVTIPKNKEKKVIAITSSADALARIIVGTSFFDPHPLFFRSSIDGTTTAGETADKTNANRAEIIH